MTLGYPVHLRLDGRRVLVAGAGRVATRKIERLAETGATIMVVAREASAPVRKLAERGRITLQLREVVEHDADGAFLVLIATDDPQANARLADAAREKGALVSRADAPETSDFTVPAVARGNAVEATVSTFGRAPSASRRLAKELRSWLNRGPDRFAAAIAEAREALHGRADSSRVLRELGEGELFAACVAGDESRVQELLADALNTPCPPLAEGS